MPSTLSTAQDTGLLAAELPDLSFSGRLSLRQRILAVNVFAIILLAGSFFYLDSYRTRLIDERVQQAATQVRMTSVALASVAAKDRPALLARIGNETGARLRIAVANKIVADSWTSSRPTFTLRNPANEPWQRHVARWLDDAIETVVDAGPPILFERFEGPGRWPQRGAGWKLAQDRTHMIWAIAPVSNTGWRVMSEANARDIRRLVRAERSRLGLVIVLITGLSVLLSLFLARTIALPLRALAHAAARVRYGRDREVNVPRLPSRRDEIGLLARALSDMSHALRERIDSTEAFAADVVHELKNPLASISSAAQGLKSVTKPDLRAQLEAIICEDVVRLDRLITDIAEISRLDARLTRTRFDPVDTGALIAEILAARRTRDRDGDVQLMFEPPLAPNAIVLGDKTQLARVIENLLDNAVSFSPQGGMVHVSVHRVSTEIVIHVDDEGPGIAENAREAIFERFHSDRQDRGSFGEHSGLGLAIVRTIITGHNGFIAAQSRPDGMSGSRFEVRLPSGPVRA